MFCQILNNFWRDIFLIVWEKSPPTASEVQDQTFSLGQSRFGNFDPVF